MINSEPSTNSPEKQLWLSVLGQLLVDFMAALTQSRMNEAEAMIRQMESEHLQFVCDACEVHPDKLKNFMQKRFNEKLALKQQNKVDTKHIKHY